MKQSMSSTINTKSSGAGPHVVIVGAGLAGISAAIALKTKLGFENFTIYEQADSVGGTWRDNTYPGCGSDVPGHWYSLSTDLNPNWQSYFANQPELRAYWENLWHKHDLAKRTKLSTSVLNAEWNAERQVYVVEVEDVSGRSMTGGDVPSDKDQVYGDVKRRTVEANVVFWAIGGFQAPLYPKDVPGIEKFKGDLFHSARWRHDVVLHKKKVGVIGNGCSAAQLIPEISKDPTVQVLNFCRTPQWFAPRDNIRYPKWIQWIFAHVPFVLRWYRNSIMLRSDIGFLIFRKNNKVLLYIARKLLSLYIRSKAPKEEVSNLIPNYAPGCKRIIVDPGYLASLKQPNVNLRWDAIDSVVENGIKMKSGEIVPLDVIVFSTGYSIEAAQLKVRGSKGTTIHEYFESKGGATAYLGSCVPGFPNQFILLGPNVASGHASVIFSEEAQINLAIQLIRPVLQGKAKSFEITEKATVEYNDWLQKRLQTSVWTDCMSYYQQGRNSKTRIVATFPGPVALFWWFCRRPKWESFVGVGAEAWEKERKTNKIRKWTFVTVLMTVALSLGLVNL